MPHHDRNAADIARVLVLVDILSNQPGPAERDDAFREINLILRRLGVSR